MRRLCVYYWKASPQQTSKKIDWIVCKECQRKIRRGLILVPARET